MMPDEAKTALQAPTRNHYFYGKLLTERDFQDEQRYFLERQRLLSRHGLGRGVLCGLELMPTADAAKVWVMPGLASDGRGRTIVVPAGYCIENPRQPTDARGEPDGPPLDGPGALTVCLHYHECRTEPVPVLVGDCDTEQQCLPNRISERYRVQLLAGTPDALPAGLSDEACAAIFPGGEPKGDFNRRRAACRTLTGACATPDERCVVLGTILFGDDGTMVVDDCSYRMTLYSNQTLFDLLLCLADRVDACCRVRRLEYVSGDAQSAPAGDPLAEPLVARVVNGDGDPVPDATVYFRVRGGGGSVTPDKVASDADGLASTQWTLGPNPGLNTVEAGLESGATVLFMALGSGDEEPPVTDPPVIRALWPPPASNLHPDDNNTARWFEIWREQPSLEVTFDRKMREQQIQDPELVHDWLRVWQVLDFGEIVVRPVRPFFDGVVDEPLLGEDGFTVRYGLEEVDMERPSRFIVIILPANDNIVDNSNPPLLLDGEFRGTRLTGALLKRIWEIEDEQVFGERDIWNRLVATNNTLPQSGDGAPGGRFDSWFGVLQELGGPA